MSIPTTFFAGRGVAVGQELSELAFQADAYSRLTANGTDFDFTIPASAQVGDIAFVAAFTDGDASSATLTGWNAIVDNLGGSEYPEGASFYKILESGDPGSTITIVIDRSDQGAGAMMVFRPDATISSVTIGNTASSDGPSSLNDTISADSPTIVASNSVRFKGYFLTGRPRATIQNPTPSFTAGGWTHVDGDNLIAEDHMDYAYKILTPGTTDVSEQVTTDDTGRQAQHLFSVTLNGE